MRLATEVLIERYQDNVYAAAYSVCRNAADAEDIVQDTFIQYHTSDSEFDSEQHIRAWLLRVAVNKAKNVSRSFRRRASVPLEEYMATLPFEAPEDRDLFSHVMRLPARYRIVIHLFYYEDYSVRDIAGILHISEGNVRVRLTRGRKLLGAQLQQEGDA